MSIALTSLLPNQAYASYRREHHARLIAYWWARPMMAGEHALLPNGKNCEAMLMFQIPDVLNSRS